MADRFCKMFLGSDSTNALLDLINAGIRHCSSSAGVISGHDANHEGLMSDSSTENNNLDSFDDLVNEFTRKQFSSLQEATTARLHLLTQLHEHLVVCFAQGSFGRARQLLGSFEAVVEFASKPASTLELEQNGKCVHLFFSLLVYLFTLMTVPTDSEDADENGGALRDAAKRTVLPFDSAEKLLKRVEEYRSDNSLIFPLGTMSLEALGICLMRILLLLFLFKLNQLSEFHYRFHKVFGSDAPDGNESRQILLMPGAAYLRSILLVCYGITFTLYNPFKDLRLQQDEGSEWLVDAFTNDPESTEYDLYNEIMLPLAQSDLGRMQQAFTPACLLSGRIMSLVAFVFPSREKEPTLLTSFWQYFHEIIDAKLFLMAISISRQITVPQLFTFMGYENPQEFAAFSRERIPIFLMLLLGLSLGKRGVRYSHVEQLFSHEPTTETKSALGSAIHNLGATVTSNAMATLVHATLFDRFYK